MRLYKLFWGEGERERERERNETWQADLGLAEMFQITSAVCVRPDDANLLICKPIPAGRKE